jgi:hypothetical protein
MRENQMKPIKMLGLAALAVSIAMTIAGAPSAMAKPVGLCGADFEKEEASEEECKPIVHVHETSVGKAVLLSSIKVECDVLFLGDEVEESETSELEGKFTYTNCGSCEVSEKNGPSIVKLLYTEHETAEVADEVLVSVVCSGFINCAFNTEGLKGTAKGALLSTQKNGEVSIQGQTINNEGGFLCPKTTKLDITTTPLVSTFVKLERCVLGRLYAFDLGNGRCNDDVGQIGLFRQTYN